MSAAIVKQMLQQQRDDFAAMVSTLVNSFNDRYDKLKETMTELRVSLEYSQQDIAAMKDTLQLQNRDQETASAQMISTQEKLKDIETTLDYLENQSRRNNVVFDGIEEDANESWQDSERKVQEILEETMELDDFTIERAHRVGKKKQQRQRPIVVKFLNYKDREDVLRNGKKLKGTTVYVREDLSTKVMNTRREQLPALKEARASGKIAYFSYDKLIIKERQFPAKDNQDLDDGRIRVTRSQSTSKPK